MNTCNQLSKPQRKWLEQFLSTRPHSNYRVYTIDGGTRTIDIAWRTEEANVIILDSNTYIAAKIKHNLVVTLRLSGHPLKDGKYTFDIIPPQKYKVDYTLYGQFTLDIPQNYVVNFPKNPVVVKRKVSRISATNIKQTDISIQQQLTLSCSTQTLQGINYKLTGVIQSEEELLRVSKVGNIELPTIIITMLNNKNATDDEFMLASESFKNGGLESVLNYIAIIEELRELKGKMV